jgi:magnesium transporter
VELAAQPGIMVGIEKEERLATPLFRSLRLRHPWLQLNLLTAFVAGTVVFVFQGTIDRLLILAMFLPVLAGQSANTGCQSLAVTLRGVFLGELKSGKEKALVLKDALLGLLNGALAGLVAAIVMYVVTTAQHRSAAPMLSAVVFLAMTGSCVISGICGAIVPHSL